MEDRKRFSAFFENEVTDRPKLTGTDAELEVLALLNATRYDCLPSHYIYSWLDQDNWSYPRKVVARLAKGQYIGIPEGARDHRNRLGRPRVYELWPRGATLLRKYGRYIKADRDPDHLEHRSLRSVIKFSFEYGARELGLKYLTEADVLAHERCPESTRQEKHPSHIPFGKVTLKPDERIFGLSLNEDAYIYFHGFEADRGTEQSSKHAGRKTYEGMIELYAQYLRAGGFKERFKLEQVTIPIICTREGDKETLKKYVAKLEPLVRKRFAFKTCVDYVDGFPPPTPHMITEPWERVGWPPLDILATLKATAERKADGRSETRTDNRAEAEA